MNLEGSFSYENYPLLQGKAGYSTELQLTVFGVQCLPQARAEVEEDRSFTCKIGVWLDLLIVVAEN